MIGLLQKYTHWLHTQWPAGTVEKLPDIGEDGATNLPGVRIAGDLTGIPLLKFSADTGARAVQAFLSESDFQPSRDASDEILDVAIIGGGVSGLSAGMQAREHGLHFEVFEAVEPWSTIRNFPKRKPIYTYPTDMTPAGKLRFESTVKEDLIDELERYRQQAGIQPKQAHVEKIEQENGYYALARKEGSNIYARRVIVAIGRSGNYRKLNVPGEDLDHVTHRLYDPTEYAGQSVLVVGGGDSALETAIALVSAGAHVTLSYRKQNFSRPKPDNLEKIEKLAEDRSAPVQVESPSSDRVNTASPFPNAGKGSLQMKMASQIEKIEPEKVTLTNAEGETESMPVQQVFMMTGREPPLDFFRRSGLKIRGEWTAKTWAGFIGFFGFILTFYHWQKGLWFTGVDPDFFAWAVSSMGGAFQSAVDNPQHLLHTLRSAMERPGFYYSFAYSAAVVAFGIRRVKRRRTPYIKLQTATLAAIQVLPLFILPWILLPWAGANGWWDAGIGGWIGDHFWPDGSYWRAFGLVLAWPLFVYNWFTSEPLWGWLILGFLQTFVVIPIMIRYWGKGAYCGWICSCGALAETMGDAHRHKMPHGPFWNRLNMVGQVILWVALLMMAFRIIGWIWPGTPQDPSWAAATFNAMLTEVPLFNYKYLVDVWIAGVLGVGLYFHFSGRVWCRFACPLAALMHIYARFSKFRIFSDKKKCISCNICTSVCHQGIDIMNFANKGIPMEDPECVRCSACVQSCPTGVLSFGRYRSDGSIKYDSLAASPVQMEEMQPTSASRLLSEVETAKPD